MIKIPIFLLSLIIIFAGCCVGFSKNKADSLYSIVGSVNSRVYHYSDCPSARAILPKNLVIFEDERTAQLMGRRICDKCLLKKIRERRR